MCYNIAGKHQSMDLRQYFVTMFPSDLLDGQIMHIFLVRALDTDM